MTHRNESKYLQSKFNYEYVMQKIRKLFGPFDPDEIAYYKKNLKNDNGEIINNFQRQLVFNLFYKYFGDVISINAINQDNYIELMLAARKMLQSYNLAFLPYILSGHVNKIVSRKVLNKKESSEMEASQYFETVKEKYRNDKILQQILGTIATIITSTFTVIDYQNQENTGKTLYIDSKIIIEETLLYTLLV